ncbi:MAG: DUF4342 domain-containing protein [Rhodobacteraceae bacterium]|nr:DUF4342 domain-containing protein [Paracoccaceae bacterium]
MPDPDKKDKTFVEVIEVTGAQLVERVKHLLREGNVRQLRIHAKDSDVTIEVPMTIGVLAGGAVALAAPWLAILGVIAALVADVKIEVERETTEPPKPAPDESAKPGGDA